MGVLYFILLLLLYFILVSINIEIRLRLGWVILYKLLYFVYLRVDFGNEGIK